MIEFLELDTLASQLTQLYEKNKQTQNDTEQQTLATLKKYLDQA